MILLIDNYDSFSYNLVQLTGSVTEEEIRVIRNDEYTAEEIEAMAPSHIILSPGPGKPADAGVCEEVVQRRTGKIPILGVCLGHQAICEAFGGVVEGTDYGADVVLSVLLPEERAADFSARVVEVSAGTAEALEDGERFQAVPWKLARGG